MTRFLLTLIAFFLLQSSAYGLEATFTPTANVDGSMIRLGDVVQFDKDSAVTRSLANQIINQSPAPGEFIILRAGQILKYLRQHIASLPPEILWNGSATVKIQRNGIAIDAQRIAAYIADYISQHKDTLPEADIHFIPTSLPMPFLLPTGHLTAEVIPSDPGILRSSRFSIIFRIDDKVVKNMSVRGHTEAMSQVVVAAMQLPRGTILRPGHLRTTQQDIAGLKGFYTSPEQITGKKLSRTLRPGSPLLRSMLTTLPIVHRGDKVKIVINSGPLRLTATGVAFKDGIRNQMIRVQNLSSRKIVYCRIAAPGLVEVIL